MPVSEQNDAPSALAPAILAISSISLLSLVVIYHHHATDPGLYGHLLRQGLGITIGSVLLWRTFRMNSALLMRITPAITVLFLAFLYGIVLFQNREDQAHALSLAGIFSSWNFIDLGKPVFALSLVRWAPARTRHPPFPKLRVWAYTGLLIAWVIPLAALNHWSDVLLYCSVFAIVFWLQGGATRHLIGIALACLSLLIFQHSPGTADMLAEFPGSPFTLLSPAFAIIVAGGVFFTVLGIFLMILLRAPTARTAESPLLPVAATGLLLGQCLLHICGLFGLFPLGLAPMPLLSPQFSLTIAAMILAGLVLPSITPPSINPHIQN